MGPLIGLLLLRLGAASPLTLDDALALAVKRNPDLEIARNDEEAAAVDQRLSYQGVLPRLDLTGTFGRQFEGAQSQVNVVPNPTPPPDFVRTPVSFPANDFGVYSLGLNLTWTIFDGLASWKAIASAKTKTASAHRQYEETALRLAFDVARRFYEVVRQQRALDVRRETVALSEELVKRSDALFTAGRGTKADTYAARVNLGNDQLALQTQAAALVRARAELASVLGLTSDAGLEVVPPAGGPPPRQELPPLSSLLASARQRRPVLDARKLSGEAADIDIARARGAYWPVVALQASYQKASPDLTGDNGVFGNPANNYIAAIQATVSWNLFAGGETSSNVQRAQVLARRAQALLEQGQQLVSAEVTIAREQVVALEDSLATAQQIVDAADKSLRFAREQLEAGIASQLEVRDAALKLAQAKLTLVSTVVDLIVARADLNRAVGGAL